MPKEFSGFFSIFVSRVEVNGLLVDALDEVTNGLLLVVVLDVAESLLLKRGVFSPSLLPNMRWCISAGSTLISGRG